MYLLQAKVSGHGDLEASIVETSIGEVEETGTVVADIGNNGQPNHQQKPVQRNLSDRYSYREAIYGNNNLDSDLVWMNLFILISLTKYWVSSIYWEGSVNDRESQRASDRAIIWTHGKMGRGIQFKVECTPRLNFCNE